MDMNEDTVELFLNNPVFTPALETVLVAALEKMEGAENRELFIKVGLQASTPDMAMVITEMAVMTAGYHKNVAAIKNFVPLARVLMAEKKDNTAVIILPTDHIIWSKRVASIGEDLVRQEVSGKHAGYEIWTLGTFSNMARANFKELGWKVHEKAGRELIPKAQ